MLVAAKAQELRDPNFSYKWEKGLAMVSLPSWLGISPAWRENRNNYGREHLQHGLQVTIMGHQQPLTCNPHKLPPRRARPGS